MDGVAETGQAILASTQQRLERTAHNVANISTPGYKRQISYSEILTMQAVTHKEANKTLPSDLVHADMQQGKFRKTDNPLDIAISGTGLFQMRATDQLVYSRQGQFRLSSDGTIVNSQGFVLQGQEGDLVLTSADAEILKDGTILEDGLPTGKIALFAATKASPVVPLSGAFFAAQDGDLEPVDSPALRQGFVESSNVSMADEMIAMMAAIRQAETGAKLVQMYDELAGRALSIFGQR